MSWAKGTKELNAMPQDGHEPDAVTIGTSGLIGMVTGSIDSIEPNASGLISMISPQGK